eukprot:TRINITY_DN2020_c0_g1_i5.p1 TRINITY_DN2020_c0_g1~~TRINITY_DN2020_c0_g1_i5.p1  ORF type:complete len:182 (+),score=50.34 TRINITY_DN2020_c0_g1_i5:675-1220(+)
MPKTNKSIVRTCDKTSRKKTRRQENGAKLPLFIINSKKYLSCYDIGNFLGDINRDKKYDFRKRFQNLKRNCPKDKVILEQKEILRLIDEEYKVHLNPNKSTPFLKLGQVLKGSFKYLLDLKIPIDYSEKIYLSEPGSTNHSVSSPKIHKDIDTDTKEEEDDNCIFSDEFELTKEHLDFLFN